MSKTPRTDMLLAEIHSQPLAHKLEQDWTSALTEHARTLERELAEALSDRDDAREGATTLNAEANKWKRELDALRRSL